MNKKTYALKDESGETHDVRMMDAEELREAQEKAIFCTDGNFGWVEFDVTYGRSQKLLKDLHAALFQTVKHPYRIPCDCPPAEPVYNSRGKVIDAKPASSCAFCRLTIAVDRIYDEENKPEFRHVAKA